VKLLFSFLSKIYSDAVYCRYKKRINTLINNGLTIGNNVTIENSVVIDENYPYLIKIGNNCSLSNGVSLLAHDATSYKFLNGHTRLGKIDIKDNVFIGTNVIILPGVTIGPNVLIAAGSVINKDIPPNSCVAGTPARFYKKFDEYLAEMQDLIMERPVFDFNELRKDHNNINDRNEKVRNAVENGICFIKGFEGKYRYTLNQQ
jgi:maltose O-acetyltransferase